MCKSTAAAQAAAPLCSDQTRSQENKSRGNPLFLPSSKPKATPNFFLSRKTQAVPAQGAPAHSHSRQMGTLEFHAVLPSELLIPPFSHEHRAEAAIKAHPRGAGRKSKKTKRYKSRGCVCQQPPARAAGAENEPLPGAPAPF